MAKKKHQVVNTDGRGRKREPLSARKALSDNPHRNRVGGKDVEGAQINAKPITSASPFSPDTYETECWNDIVKSQSDTAVGAWVYESDYQYLYAHCILWARLRTIQIQMDAFIKETGGVFDGEKVHPLVGEERRANAEFRASLSKLGWCPPAV